MSLAALYDHFVVDLDLCLRQMSDAGVRVDLDERERLLHAASSEADALREQMQAIVPPHVRFPEPKSGFVRTPKDTANLYRRPFAIRQKACPVCGVIAPRKKDLTICGITKADLIEVDVVVERWCRLKPFVPSNAQVLRYCREMGHPVQFSTKKKPGKGHERSATADEKALQRLVKKVPKDPLYPRILDYREVEHRVGQIESLTIGKDGRIHTTFLHTPSTGRLASGFPAMQNIPLELRRLVIATEGMRLFKHDYKGIEAQLVGYFMQQVNAQAGADYIRLAKLGIHAYFLSHVIGQPADLKWSDADLGAYFSELKEREPKRYKAAKQTIHASNYRETPFGMHMQQPTIFPSIKDAEFYQAFYYDLVPALGEWHWQTCEEAERQGLLRNPWGFPHRFYDVFRYEKNAEGKWERTFGAMANAAIAFKPQSTAAFIMRQAILNCFSTLGPLGRYLRLTIHDELFGEAPAKDVEEVAQGVKMVMEMPIPQLPLDSQWGLGAMMAIETEGGIGDRWGTF